MIKEVIKRNGKTAKFVGNKIRRAIEKANAEVPELERATEDEIDKIVKDIKYIKVNRVHIETIQNMVEISLMKLKHFELAKKYIIYRYTRNLGRELSEAELSVLGIIKGINDDVLEENSNKHGYTNSTQRDLMAGEVSKTLAKKVLLPPDILEAIYARIYHWHDMDYTAQNMINCFSRSQRFITSEGTISFEDVSDGDELSVYGHDGRLHHATVHKYGVQPLYKYTFRRGTYTSVDIYATRNHTWFLRDGSKTTNLTVGDRLYQTPVIEDFNIDALDSTLALYWCLGFCLGDGSDYDNTIYGQTGSRGIRVRLCGNKQKFAKIFTLAGFNVTHPSHEKSDDLYVCLPQYSKKDILKDKSYYYLSLEEKKALFNGYLSSDGEFRKSEYATGISTIDTDIREFVHVIGESCGYYIGAERLVTGSTNFTDARTPMYHIQFNRKQYEKQPWILSSVEYSRDEEVWCLEVDDVHSFILSGGIVTGNCCLIDIKGILDFGTVLNGLLIESPHSFRVACNIMTQVIANIASNQYGGQSVAIKHLGKYLAISRERTRIKFSKMWDNAGIKYTNEQLDKVVEEQLKFELEEGIQTIQYQINTLMTTNGQAPFLTIFMHIDETSPYKNEIAMIVEEIIRQRHQGVKNKDGHYITPAFPKLIYVLDENNCLDPEHPAEFDYITEMAAKCTIKRSYPDYISAKKMREEYDGEVFSCMGCRSFLSAWKKTEWYVKMMGEPEEEIGKYKWEGRFNQGVVTLNLPQIAIIAEGDFDVFWQLLDERLAKCYRALLYRHKLLEDTLTDTSPLHWQFGGISRLKSEENINQLLHDGYSTISLGYIGIYETVYAMLGVSHTTPEGEKLALQIMNRLRQAVDMWKEQTGLGFGLYGTPAESLCYKFCKHDAEKYGLIPNVTDKGYYTNSYHVDVREEINAFEKFEFEAQFQPISSGGCISYCEIPNLDKNLPVVKKLIFFIYNTLKYAEFNSKSDYCFKCGYDGQIDLNEDNNWECPCCHNTNMKYMSISRRTCGYLGQDEWNWGKRKEMGNRREHL